ncbi:MAG: hypothetical protein QXL01_00090 [Thermoplasmatales archaeon]
MFGKNEPNLVARIDKAKAHAQRIVNGQVETEEDFIYAIRLYLSNIYKIPIFSKYFEDLELDKLIFEAELHRAERLTDAERSTELINKNKDELSSMFDRWEEQDLQEIANSSDKQFENEVKAFMESGKFKGE